MKEEMHLNVILGPGRDLDWHSIWHRLRTWEEAVPAGASPEKQRDIPSVCRGASRSAVSLRCEITVQECTGALRLILREIIKTFRSGTGWAALSDRAETRHEGIYQSLRANNKITLTSLNGRRLIVKRVWNWKKIYITLLETENYPLSPNKYLLSCDRLGGNTGCSQKWTSFILSGKRRPITGTKLWPLGTFPKALENHFPARAQGPTIFHSI